MPDSPAIGSSPGAEATIALSLRFLDDSDQAFAAAARELIASGYRRLAIPSGNERAERIAQTVNQSGMCEIIDLKDPRAEAALLPISDGQALGTALLDFLDADPLTIIAPRTDWYFKRRPLFLISVPKAGTHLLYELAQAFGYEAGVELGPDGAKGGTWYCIEHSNSHTSARHFFIETTRERPFGNRAHPFMTSPALFIYRNPRDVVVSESNYYHQEGNSPFADYLAHLTPEERLSRLIDDRWLFGSFRDRMAEFVPWLDFRNVIPLSFEELIGPQGGGDADLQRRLIWSIQLKLQIPGSPEDFARKVFNSESPTFFSGRIGAWRSRFSPEIAARFAALPQDFVETFGFAGERDDLPARAEEFRRRPLMVSKTKFDDTPINLEYGYNGCNVVLFRNRVYAIPQSYGPLDLATADADVLNAFVSGDSLDAVKATLMQNGGGPETSAAKLLESVGGYNLVAVGQRYFAARQGCGEVNLGSAASRETFRASAPNALLEAGDLDTLKLLVRTAAAENALTDSEAARTALLTEVERDAVRIDALEKELQIYRRSLLRRVGARITRLIQRLAT